MKSTVISSLSPLLILSLAACGGGESSTDRGDNNLSQDDAEQAFDATAKRTGSAAEQAQNSSAFTQAFNRLAQELDVDVDIDCAEGGSASLNGSLLVPDDAESIDTEMNFTVVYSDCAEDGIALDGDLSYWSSITQEDTRTEMSTSMTGDVEFSGDIEGSCAIDAEIHVSMDFGGLDDGDFGNFEIDVEASGSFCGYDLSELDAEMTDPDSYEGGF